MISAIRILLVIMLLASFIFDTVTFLKSPGHQIYETNPIYLLTKSVMVLLLLKTAFVIGLCFFIVEPKFFVAKTIRYMVLLSIFYLCFMQVLGGISNIQTVKAQPVPNAETVLPQQEAVEAYMKFQLVYYVIPLLLAITAFASYNHGGFDLDV